MTQNNTNHYKLCGLIPCYNNAATIRKVSERMREDIPNVFIINDGSNEATTQEIETLKSEGFFVVHREKNGGKGAAVKTGFRAAKDAGFTHAIQVDADGQHDLEKIKELVVLSKNSPEALILGYPVFDESAPLGRRLARKITLFWTHIETLGRKIVDPMCGFRVYPLDAVLAAGPTGDFMEFDIEIAVKTLRLGIPVINTPVKVRYLDKDEGGLSNFRVWKDNVAISVAHTKLVFGIIPWLFSSNKKQISYEKNQGILDE